MTTVQGEFQTVDPALPDTGLDPDDTPLVFGVPLNRIVAFVGPQISLLSGTVATWLLTHLNVLGLFDNLESTTGFIAQALTFLLGTGLTWLGQQQWLKGHHMAIEGAQRVRVVAAAAEPARLLLPVEYELGPGDADEALRRSLLKREQAAGPTADEATDVPTPDDLAPLPHEGDEFVASPGESSRPLQPSEDAAVPDVRGGAGA